MQVFFSQRRFERTDAVMEYCAIWWWTPSKSPVTLTLPINKKCIKLALLFTNHLLKKVNVLPDEPLSLRSTGTDLQCLLQQSNWKCQYVYTQQHLLPAVNEPAYRYSLQLNCTGLFSLPLSQPNSLWLIPSPDTQQHGTFHRCRVCEIREMWWWLKFKDFSHNSDTAFMSLLIKSMHGDVIHGEKMRRSVPLYC